MGRNDGAPQEQPEHEVEVPEFWLDKTEVTNAEYQSFVAQANHAPPAHWVNGKPLAGQENFPVVHVSLDDIKAFAEWRSKRDGVTYRLPTEQEWEYASRNGGENNLYPWGDKWENQHAVIDLTAPKAVGTLSGGANKWGVQDLIGNVWEWTSSKIKPYPNSNVGFSKPDNIVIRGGGYTSKSAGERAIT
jgi:formylglycine-generating enzyme required for sulfatase activity